MFIQSQTVAGGVLAAAFETTDKKIKDLQLNRDVTNNKNKVSSHAQPFAESSEAA